MHYASNIAKLEAIGNARELKNPRVAGFLKTNSTES